MLLEKLYSDFITHTGLTDSTYKSVFLNISEILERVKEISLKSISYTDSSEGSKPSVFDFGNMKTVPSYVVDVFKNIFLNYYALPRGAVAELALSYRGVPFSIINDHTGTIIPNEIEFIQDYKIFNMFILDNPVYDVFSPFDSEFGFIESFKPDMTDIFPPLKKKFENSFAKEHVIEKNEHEGSVASVQLTVENIQQKIRDALGRVEEIGKIRERLQQERYTLFSGINSREALLLERDKLSIEGSTLHESAEAYLTKVNKVKSVLRSVDAELSDQELRGNTKQEDIDFLRESKIRLENEKTSLENTILSFNTFIKENSDKMRDIQSKLSAIENYTTNDVDVMDQKIKQLDSEQDDLYGILIGLEAELRNQKKALDERSLNFEKAASYSEMTIQNVENTAIVGHLSSPRQPSSVITVANYLRQYYAYVCTVLSKSIIDEQPDIPVPTAQAVASKLVMVRAFGLYFDKIFSSVDFADNRIGRVIPITRD